VSQNDPKQPNTPRPGGGDPDPQFNWRGLLLFAVAFALIGGAFIFRGGNLAQVDELSYPKFSELLAEGKIVSTAERPLELVVEGGRETQSLSGYYRKMVTMPPAVEPEERMVQFKTPVFMPLNGAALAEQLKQAGITPATREESNLLATTLIGFLPILIFLVLLYFIFRSQIKMAGRGAMSFGKSKARMMAREKNKTTFKDVAGVEEAKEEVSELVDFLKDPKKFQKLGGRIPKGVLMVGPPGTGKTLLARAIAGEADVPFFSISGSDFVEMFVGVGASRVRDMFEQGKKSAPCLIFIDEIDAVGRHRGHGMGGGHDEREQTLNALLVEMDGFDAQDGVIIIAATNRPDVLDPALLRPGRFDRQVTVNLPDVRGREEILRVHIKKVKVAEAVNLAVIARGTPGYSGAELANVINEAALLAARRGLKAISMRELEEARDKVRWGKERRSMAISEKEKEVTAYHEAGHALLLELLEHTAPLHKVTIIPRGPSLGSTMWLPEEDKYNTRRKELLDHLVVIMGGRVAEDIVFGDVTSGARGDIKQATSIARKMVCQWGMSEKMGMIEYGEGDEPVFLARDMGRMRDYSESTAQAIDQEVKMLIDEAYNRAKVLLLDGRPKLDLIARALLEYETLEGSQIRDLIAHGEMKEPPHRDPPPPPIPTVQAEPAADASGKKGDGELPGGLAPVPA
jgi:cell division protease FtsH